MSTGDLKNNVRRLQSELKTSRFTGEPDLRGLVAGSPPSFLPLLHFALLSYSYPLAVHLADRGYDLYGKNDARFVDVLYKLLRDEFSYQPRLTKSQLLSQSGFAEHKAIFVSDVLRLCRQHHALLVKQGPPPTKPVASRTLAGLAQAKPSGLFPHAILDAKKGQRQVSSSGYRQPTVSDGHHQTASSKTQAPAPRRPFHKVGNLSRSAKVVKHNAQTKSLSSENVQSRPCPVPLHGRNPLGKENLVDFVPAADISGQFDLQSNCMGVHVIPNGGFDSGLSKPEHLQSARQIADLRPLPTEAGITTVLPDERTSGQATTVPCSKDCHPTVTTHKHQAAVSSAETWAVTGNSRSVYRVSQSPTVDLAVSQAACYQVAENLQPSPMAPKPSISRFHDALPPTSNQHSQHSTMFDKKETEAHFEQFEGVSKPSTYQQVYQHHKQLSAQEKHQEHGSCGLEDEEDPLPPQSRAPYQQVKQVISSNQQSAHGRQPSSVLPLQQQGQALLTDQPAANLRSLEIRTSQPQVISTLAQNFVPDPSSNYDQFKVQLDTISTQLGHLGSQLNQLVLADHSRARGPPIEKAVQLLPAESQSSTRHLENIVQNMSARMILLETRLQQLECQRMGPDRTVGTSQQSALPSSSISSDQPVGPVKPAVPVAGNLAAIPDITPFLKQNREMDNNGLEVHDSDVHCTISGDTTCPTVITERRAITVATPHTKAMSTVSMDISYVFSDPQVQAHVSGVNNQIRQTRSILQRMTTPIVSSTLQQQLLLASAINGQNS